MSSAFHDLHDTQYENLVVALCSFILGDGVQGFTKGVDGGKDGKFIGKATSYPSVVAPWNGKIIIQAKHTTSLVGLFSDSDFSSSTNSGSVLNKEIPRIKTLIKNGELDYYMLFSNRKLSGVSEDPIKTFISEQSGLSKDNIALIDTVNLTMLLNKYGQAYKVAGISPLVNAFQIFPDDLAVVLEAFIQHKESLVPSELSVNVPIEKRTAFALKNQINGLSEAYAKSILKGYFCDFEAIREFLAAPQNESFQRNYMLTAEDFNFKLLAEKHKYDNFDQVLNMLFERLRVADEVFKKNVRLTRTVLFYMYWNCDLGEDANALSD
jgi:hypothetical protein